MRAFVWLARALVFFTLFAFALNNQQQVELRWFFGHAWHAPMVLVVLSAFVAGCALTWAVLLPRLWKHGSAAPLEQESVAPAPTANSVRHTDPPIVEPPRDGL